MSRALLAAAGVLLAPGLAHACAVCGAAVGSDQSRIAYFVTSGVLSLLPLALMGGFLLWVRRRARAAARAAEAGGAEAEPQRSRRTRLTAS